MARAIGDLMGPSHRKCRLRRVSSTVQVSGNRKPGEEGERLSMSGVSTCRFHLCPMCAPAIMRRRGEEIQKAINNWGAGRVYFLTLTVKHHGGMDFCVLQKLITNAYGRLWSGRAGRELAEALQGPVEPTRAMRKAKPVNLDVLVPDPVDMPHPWDLHWVRNPTDLFGTDERRKRKTKPKASWVAMKPHTVRAHDRTYSREIGFHPHLHCLMFLHVQIEEEVLWKLLHERWEVCLRQALKAFRDKSLQALRDGELARKRVQKLFGMRLFPRTRTVKYSAERVRHALKAFRIRDLLPNEKRGVHVERVRQPDRVPRYLAKLGCELAGMWTKEGRADERGHIHYGQWQLAQLAADKSGQFYGAARAAWRKLYEATVGGQSLTWSTGAREALQIDVLSDKEIVQDDVDETGQKPVEEWTRLLAEIDGDVWDDLVRAAGHELIGWIHAAHQAGTLGELAFVRLEPQGSWASMGRARDPKKRTARPEWWVRVVGEVKAERRQMRTVREREKRMLDEELSPTRGKKRRPLSEEQREALRRSARYRLFELGILPAPTEQGWRVATAPPLHERRTADGGPWIETAPPVLRKTQPLQEQPEHLAANAPP